MPILREKKKSERPLSESFREYFRGIAGGFLFSLPLLFTNEMWRSGSVLKPYTLLAGLGFTMLLLLAYNNLCGIRRDASWGEIAIDSVEEFGIGIIISFAVLCMIGQIDTQMKLDDIAGKVVIEAMVASIGVSVGTAQLGVREDSGNGKPISPKEMQGRVTLNRTTVAVCGAFLVGMNVGPTDEIVQIAATSGYVNILLIGIFSFVTGGIVLYYSDFRGSHHLSENKNLLSVLRGSVFTYIVALVIAFLILLFFGRLEDSGFTFDAGQIVVLSFATNLGSSAGRLLLQWE